MTDIIRLLPDAIANQIAAGEVIQRPASLVKEMLENAIDAGSTKIELIVKNAGKTLVQVIDNGSGMSETDARMCFERHATSKLRHVNDLFAIRTLGFRGEAMASIAAVAQVELKTRPREKDLGTHILMEGSTVTLQQPCQCAEGTSISVKNLFFNVPARRNFLKSNKVEMRHIVDEFVRVVLANPKIAFALYHNEVEVFKLPADNLRKRIVGIFGKSFKERLIPIQEETEFLRIFGFVGKPKFARKTRGEQYFFVNERFIKSNYLNHAVVKAYQELLTPKTYPLYVIFIDIDPTRIDVNVHPTKQEINFDDEKIIYTFILGAVKKALSTFNITPAINFDEEVNLGFLSPKNNKSVQNTSHYNPFSKPLKPASSGKKPTQKPSTNTSNQSPQSPDNQKDKSNNLKQIFNKAKKAFVPKNWQEVYETAPIEKSPKATSNPKKAAPKKPLTITIESDFSRKSKVNADGEDKNQVSSPYQLHRRYILTPIKSGYILVDQQAAHERILFEKYLQTFANMQAVTQKQLFTQTIELPPMDAQILKNILPDINALGYDIQEFGQCTFVIQGVPSDIGNQGDSQAMIEELIEQYKLNLTELKLDKRTSLVATLAKNMAIKAGRKLSVEEMKGLLDQLFACQMPFVAPNGRATFVKYNLLDIDKQFKQKGHQ